MASKAAGVISEASTFRGKSYRDAPFPRTLSPYLQLPIECNSHISFIVIVLVLSNHPLLTKYNSLDMVIVSKGVWLVALLPYLGSLFCKGVWPPSKPTALAVPR